MSDTTIKLTGKFTNAPVEPQLTKAEGDMLEALVDHYTLSRVVAALACICEGKAEHLRVNWQDRYMATIWEVGSVILTANESTLRKRGL